LRLNILIKLKYSKMTIKILIDQRKLDASLESKVIGFEGETLFYFPATEEYKQQYHIFTKKADKPNCRETDLLPRDAIQIPHEHYIGNNDEENFSFRDAVVIFWYTSAYREFKDWFLEQGGIEVSSYSP
jgi:hypothetical protein